MKKFLKSVAIAMLVVMIINLPTGIVYAQNETFEENFLDSIGIIDINENYNSEAPISRVEFVKTVLKMEGIDIDGFDMDIQPFFDVTEADNFFNAVNVAYSLGYIKGGTDGCFRPYSAISIEEAVTVLLRALGGDDVIKAAGGTDALASALGLYKNLNVAKSSDCTYKDAAILVYSAMTASGIGQDADGTYKLVDSSSILGNIFKMKYVTGIVDGNYKKSVYNNAPTEYNEITVNEKVYKLENEKYNDLFFGQTVTVYYTENSAGEYVAAYIEAKNNNVSVLEFEDVVSLNSDKVVYDFSNSNKVKELKLSKNCVTMLNNSRLNLIGSFDVSGNGSMVCIDNNDDKYIDVLDITTYDIYLVKNVNTDYKRITFENSDSVIELDDYEYCRIIDVNGENLEFGDINRYDVAEISLSNDKKYITITVIDEQSMISVAQITKKSGESYSVITADDGSEYKTINNFTEVLKSGETYLFAFDSKGNICFKVEDGEKTRYKLGCVMGVAVSDKAFANEGKIKIIGTDEKVYDLIIPKKVLCQNYKAKISFVQAVEEIKQSQVIRFIEEDGVLTSFEVASDDENYDGLQLIAKPKNTNNIDTQYWKAAALIGGRIPVDNNTVIITHDTSQNASDEKAYSFTGMSSLVNQQYYPNTSGYRVGNKDVYADVVIIKDFQESVTKDSQIMLISSIYKEYDEESEMVRIIFEGLVSNSTKKFALYNNDLLTYTTVSGEEIELGIGDCIRYTLSVNSEIKNIKLMFDYSDMKLYGVNDGDDLSVAYGARELHRTGTVTDVQGDYVKLEVDGISAEENYFYSLKNIDAYQVSESRNGTICETITSFDIMSRKNDPNIKDKVFVMMVYGNTRVFVVYKAK